MEEKTGNVDPSAAFCGLYCGACPVFIATREEGGLKTEDGDRLECGGCRSGKNPPWCAECKLKECARSRKLEFCSQCAEYPCAEYSGFRDDPKYPYHQECPDYLSMIRDGGWRPWLMEMEAKWTCPDCGRPASWWDRTCLACGVRMPGFKKP